MEAIKTIPLSLKDIYQLLIAECRYGYTRLNHLMPGGAYQRAEEILPKMAELDKDYADHIAQQLLEECISQNLCVNFINGEDDVFDTRAEALQFIEWLFDFISDKTWKPYNYGSYQHQLACDDLKRWNVYELIDDEKKYIAGPVSVKDYPNIIFDLIKDENTYITYTKSIESYADDTPRQRPTSFIYNIKTPVQKRFLVEHI